MVKLVPKIFLRKEIIKTFLHEKYSIGEDGGLLIPDAYSSRLFVNKINDVFNKSLLPGKLHSYALLNTIYDYIIERYDTIENKDSLSRVVDELKNILDVNELQSLISIFNITFLNKKLLKQEISLSQFLELLNLENTTKKLHSKKQILIYLSNLNPAINDLKFLFHDADISELMGYKKSNEFYEEFFRKQKPVEKFNKPLIDFLKEPILNYPENLEAQLNYIKEKWASILPEEILTMILKSLDLIKEDSKIFQTGFGGVGETKVLTFSIEELLGFGDKFSGLLVPLSPIEEEKFTPDIDWMPKVVLLAKNIYVWLYQLSKKYNREIRKLDEIPDEELDLIASYNFNALWLIGIWERSPASKKIKNISGNPEALASAYSIYDYVIANDLGGETAFNVLNQKCLNRGIRLACDIVPNHMGIYSRWIIEHTDYFIQTERSPFPSYSFTGPDLSEHPDYQIRIEDKYWTRQDAAVVFQLIENKTGKVRYIYHGNDGTSTPWNDTAQLNLLKPEVREALINLIFKVAEKFSIIRLDAAMTLTQKHYQRLWFPVPGTGGSIPSRSDFSISTDEFLRRYPKEFWREVVDRINVEKPDTLLLAEAFWLMEGYFVRTLGMHRVYNSAFMNMLKNQENAKYRKLVTNTLEFNPEILKRYVNFLSNPDEETAINQFGDGDKLIGCTVMMVTMPGLPMFAHGQIEGLREKYGHEFFRAYYDEHPNEYLIERHRREIFPLMKKRHLFSQVEKFEFYDFKNGDGYTIEDVFVYSNCSGNERALVFYNNSYSTFEGYIKFSCLKNYGSSEVEDQKKLLRKSLGEALGLVNSEKHFYIFRETRTNLEFLRKGKDFYEKNFNLLIRGYEYFVFIDFIEIYDSTGELEELYNKLGFNGVQSINYEIFKIRISKIVKFLKQSLNKNDVVNILNNSFETSLWLSFLDKLRKTIKGLAEYLKFDQTKLEVDLLFNIMPILEMAKVIQRIQKRKSNPKWLNNLLMDDMGWNKVVDTLYNYLISNVFYLIDKYSHTEKHYKKVLIDELMSNLADSKTNHDQINLIQVLLKVQKDLYDTKNFNLYDGADFSTKNLEPLLNDEMIKVFLEVNEYQNEIYYSKEKFEELLNTTLIISLIEWIKARMMKLKDKKVLINLNEFTKELKVRSSIKKEFIIISENAEYKLIHLLEKLDRNIKSLD